MERTLHSYLVATRGPDAALASLSAASADVIVLDAGAVPHIEERMALAKLAADLLSAGRRVQVLVRRARSGFAREDFDLFVQPGLAAIGLCGLTRPQDVRDADVLLREFELDRGLEPGATAFALVIETAAVLVRCQEFALASDRVVGLVLDERRLADDLGLVPTQEGRERDGARTQVVLLARALGLLPFAFLPEDPDDLQRFEAETRLVRSFGFAGRYVTRAEYAGIVDRVYSTGMD